MDYSTVGVALVVGLGSGLVGTIISTQHDRAEGERQRAHDARERQRDRQIAAAEDFLQAITLAVRSLSEFASNRNDQGLQDRAQATLIEVLLHGERLRLVFPADIADAATVVSMFAQRLHRDLRPDPDADPEAAEPDVDPIPFLDAASDFRLAVVELTRVEVA